MEKIIHVTLPSRWEDFSRENPKGPPTFMRREYKGKWTNILQLSFALYLKGKLPSPSERDLVSLSQKAGTSHHFGEVMESASGNCTFGIFGTTVFRSDEYPRAQVWYLSNGEDFILVSYLCTKEPDLSELTEAQAIVMSAKIN